MCVIEKLQHKVDFPVLGVSFIMGNTPQTISKLFSDDFFCLLCTRNIMAYKVDFPVLGVPSISFLKKNNVTAKSFWAFEKG